MSQPRVANRWRAPRLLLILAFVVSLIAHFLSISGDMIYDYVMNGTSPDTHEKLRKATHKLSAQEWDDDDKRPEALKGIKRPDVVTVWLMPKQPAIKAPVVVAVAPKPEPRKASPVVRRKPKPAVQLASRTSASAASATDVTVASAPTSSWFSSASAVASAPASETIAAASAPAPAGNGKANHGTTASSPQIASAASPASASAPQIVAAAKGFPQTVAITYKYQGLPIPARLKWEAQGDRYSLNIAASMFGKSRAFSSVGSISKDGLAPDRFSDTRDGKLQNEALFDWSSHQLTLHDGNKTIQADLHAGDQDLFSAAFQFALQGSRMKNFTFSLASGRKVYPNVAFEILGEKTLKLSGKPVDAILLRGLFEDRVFDFWLAPQWSNLPVRMVLNMGKDSPLDIWATEIEIDGNTVLEAPIPGLDRPRGPHG